MRWIIETFSKIAVVIGTVLLVYGAVLHRTNPVVVGGIIVAIFIWPAFARRGR